MCLIVAKPRGVQMPSVTDFKRWHDIHGDGFGLAFQHEDQVHGLKGAMSKKQILKTLDKMRTYLHPINPADVDIIFHFRQATEGSVIPENCHPFPVTTHKASHRYLDYTIKGAVLAHNGIIHLNTDYDKNANTTDTQKFIELYLSDLGDSLYNATVQKMIAELTRSRFAILTSNKLILIGDFITANGLHYSNNTYCQQPLKAIWPPLTYNWTPFWKREAYEDTITHDAETDTCALCGDRFPVIDLFDDEDGALCFDCLPYVRPEYGTHYHEDTINYRR